MSRYCTLAQAKDAIKTFKATDDDKVFDLILGVSQRIDGLLNSGKKRKRPYFMPYIESRMFKVRPFLVNSNDQTFNMGENLLSLTSVVTNGQTVTSNIQAWFPNFPPMTKLQLKNTSYSWYTLDTNPPDGRSIPEPIVVTGIWGYHDDYDNAWLATDTLGAAIADATTTSITVATAASFSPGMLIKIDNEYMEVTAIAAPVLTVVRGANGSTGIAHLNAAPISVWQIAQEIIKITARQTGQFYARRGSYDISQITQAGIIQYPRDLNAELKSTLEPYLGNF